MPSGIVFLIYDNHAYVMLTVKYARNKCQLEKKRLKLCFESQGCVLRFGQQRAKQKQTKIGWAELCLTILSRSLTVGLRSIRQGLRGMPSSEHIRMLNRPLEIPDFLLPTLSSETQHTARLSYEFRQVPGPELPTVASVSAAPV